MWSTVQYCEGWWSDPLFRVIKNYHIADSIALIMWTYFYHLIPLGLYAGISGYLFDIYKASWLATIKMPLHVVRNHPQFKDVPDFLSSASSCRLHEEILFCSSMISLMHSASFPLMLNLVYRVQHTSSTALLRSGHSSLTIFLFVRFYKASWSWILSSSYFKNSVTCSKLDDCPSLEDWV